MGFELTFNPFQSISALYVETSQLICNTNQVIGFYMKLIGFNQVIGFSTGVKWFKHWIVVKVNTLISLALATFLIK